MIEIEWAIEENITPTYIAHVPIAAHQDPSKQGGKYVIRICRRPHYCDRGDWQFFVDGYGDSRLDECDGFPRFFFGTLVEAQTQMGTWVTRRKECHIKPKQPEHANVG